MFGVFPEGEEIPIGCLCLDLISRQNERSTQLQVCRCADGITNHNSAVVENLLELGSGFGALIRSQIGEATHIDWI